MHLGWVAVQRPHACWPEWHAIQRKGRADEKNTKVTHQNKEDNNIEKKIYEYYFHSQHTSRFT